MSNKFVLTLGLVFVLLCMLGIAIKVERVEASATIYIRANGLVEGTDRIVTSDNVTYTFTDNINDAVVVERSNILIDGVAFSIVGSESGIGLNLTTVTNVTIINTNIRNFTYGIQLYSSSNNSISGNNITETNSGIILSFSDNNSISGNNITATNYGGISIVTSDNNSIIGNSITATQSGISLTVSSYNSISGNNIANNQVGIWVEHCSNTSISVNNITENNEYGIRLDYLGNTSISGNNIINHSNGKGVWLVSTWGNSISGNNIAKNEYGIRLANSENNTISGNTIARNHYGIWLFGSSNNSIYHNDFVYNIEQAIIASLNGLTNVWDDGYPSGGNYWSDYEERYPNATELDGSGIWDTPYVIDETNRDKYPIIPEFPSMLVLSLFLLATLMVTILYRRRLKFLRIQP